MRQEKELLKNSPRFASWSYLEPFCAIDYDIKFLRQVKHGRGRSSILNHLQTSVLLILFHLSLFFFFIFNVKSIQH